MNTVFRTNWYNSLRHKSPIVILIMYSSYDNSLKSARHLVSSVKNVELHDYDYCLLLPIMLDVYKKVHLSTKFNCPPLALLYLQPSANVEISDPERASSFNKSTLRSCLSMCLKYLWPDIQCPMAHTRKFL